MSWADAHDEEFQPKVYDDLTGHELDRSEVRKARLNEIEVLTSVGVWDVASREQCIARTGREPIRGRWVDINKGDDNNKVYKSRYVAMESRKTHGGNARERLFSAMLPLEALKLLISLTVSHGHKKHEKDPHKPMFIDISKASLHADVINPELYVELPAEMNLPSHCGPQEGFVWYKGCGQVLGERPLDYHFHTRVRQREGQSVLVQACGIWKHGVTCALTQGGQHTSCGIALAIPTGRVDCYRWVVQWPMHYGFKGSE